MSFYITNLVLDIAYGTTYWVLKKTANGIYYLINRNNDKANDKQMVLYQENIINDLYSKIKIQENKINKLKDNLEELKDLIKK